MQNIDTNKALVLTNTYLATANALGISGPFEKPVLSKLLYY
jgi:hypothetical protein